MSVPQTKDGSPKELALKLPPLDEWRLNDMELFEAGGFTVKAFKAFMASYSHWTAAEVGLLTVNEMKDVISQISVKIDTTAVPKASGAGS